MDKAFTEYQYLTLYLVESDVRPACLFFDSEFSKQLEENIKRYFPKLQIHYDSFFGYFISKSKLNINSNSDSNDIGKILGYPTDETPYTQIDHNKDVYGSHIIITLIDNQQISLLDVTTQNSVSEQMINIMKKMSAKLLLPECIYCDKIIYIHVNEDIIHSNDYYCTKLLKTDEITDDDIFNIKNKIRNVFDNKLSEFNYNFKSGLHIGIIISLLLYCKNNPTEQFYGPFYGKCNITKKMIEINNNFAKDILSILEFTS